jgi:LytS/YehU family sensor histidine kinase
MPARHTIGASPGHGLYSVDQRLRKTYCEAGGLEIGADRPQGTIVALSIPEGFGG